MVNGDDFEVTNTAVEFSLDATLDLGATGNASFNLTTGTGLVLGATGSILFGPGQTLSVTNGTFTHSAGGTLGNGALVLNGTATTFGSGFDVGVDFESLVMGTSGATSLNVPSINHSGGTFSITNGTLTTTGAGLTNEAGQTITVNGPTINGADLELGCPRRDGSEHDHGCVDDGRGL